MKKVLLLGALLSTMAFGVAPSGATEVTQDINLTGTSVEPLAITSDDTTIEFGSVVAGTYKEESKEITFSGEANSIVKLTAEISGTKATLLTVGLDGTSGNSQEATKDDIAIATGVTMRIKYSPNLGTDDLVDEKVTLTAIYN